MLFKSSVKGHYLLHHHYRFITKLSSSSTSSSILDIPVQLHGLKDIASRYDVILFDQFGVLHDGTTVFPGVLEVLHQLKSLNKTLGVVSNTSRRSIDANKALIKLGIPSDTFDSFITSGELAFNHLSREYSNKDASCTVLTWKGMQLSFLSSLGIKLATPETADFIYLHGSESLQVSDHSSQSIPLDLIKTGILDSSIETMLRVALKRKIPLLCANSDHTAVTNDQLLYMPGVVADAFEEMGGEVLHFGKPGALVFDTAIEQCLSIRSNKSDSAEVKSTTSTLTSLNPSRVETSTSMDMNPMKERMRDIALRRQRARILHVGDSLSHDILGKLNSIQSFLDHYCNYISLFMSLLLGAKNARIDSLLISSHGIHRHKLHPIIIPVDQEGETAASNNNHPYYLQKDQSKLGDNSLLFRVCQLCDDLAISRPNFILPTLQWTPR